MEILLLAIFHIYCDIIIFEVREKTVRFNIDGKKQNQVQFAPSMLYSIFNFAKSKQLLKQNCLFHTS